MLGNLGWNVQSHRDEFPDRKEKLVDAVRSVLQRVARNPQPLCTVLRLRQKQILIMLVVQEVYVQENCGTVQHTT